MSYSRDQLERMARAQASRVGVDEDIFARLIARESGYDPTARSGAGALGLAQIMSATGQDPGYGVRPIRDRLDPVESLRFGADYLSAMLDKYDGDYERALAAYNAGPGRVDDGGELPGETVDYVDYVLGSSRGAQYDSFDDDGSAGSAIMENLKKRRKAAMLSKAMEMLRPSARPEAPRFLDLETRPRARPRVDPLRNFGGIGSLGEDL